MTSREDLLLDELVRTRALVQTLRAQLTQISQDYATLFELVGAHQCTPQPQEATA